MLDRLWVIFSKETIDNLRDRRSVFNALFAVLINPIMYVVLFGFLNRTFSDQIDRQLLLPVQGRENAPGLIAFLDQNNVEIVDPPADPEAAARAGDVDVVLVIPPDFGEQFRDGVPARVQLITDQSNQSAGITAERVRSLIGQYSSQIGNLRLLARGISPAITYAVPVETLNVTPETQGAAGVVLNLLPVVMMTAAFYGGFYLAVDTTAGERERKSLEPLLLNPVPRGQFVMGKFLAVLAFTTMATFLATAFFLVLLGIPAIQEFTDIRVNLGWDTIGSAVLIMLPVIILAVGLEMLTATYARSVKEAQTYTQLVAFAGFLPALFLSVLPIQPQGWMYAIPTISQLYFINDISRGEPLDMTQVILASVVTAGIGIAALIAAMRRYRQEKVLLGVST
jgi:sodium transport system permease protein